MQSSKHNTSQTERKCMQARSFVCDLGLIFRQDDDLDHVRIKLPSDPSTIIKKLQTFLIIQIGKLFEKPIFKV